jgi:phage tail sheath protein FI
VEGKKTSNTPVYTFPGVYIEEIPSGIRTITGVSTSITAFIGQSLRGPIIKAKLIHSFLEFERYYGGLWKKSNMSYAVYHYFQNGGNEAVIVRAYNPKKKSNRDEISGKANFTILDSNLKFEAASPGEWGKYLEITIDHDVESDNLDNEAPIFNLTIEDKRIGTRENFLNLSTNIGSQRFIKKILHEESNLIRIVGNVPKKRPPEGTTKECTELLQTISLVDESASDGDIVEDSSIIGNQKNKTGIYALDSVNFNLLCIPPYKNDETPSGDVYAKALDYCEKRRAILILDPPKSWNSNDKPKDPNTGIDSPDFQLKRHRNAAIYFPRIKAIDPRDNKLREFVPCGAVAGVIARTDIQRGIWKSPAGMDANLNEIHGFSFPVTDKGNDELNQLGINCLRIMPAIGPVIWGARTMMGADKLASEWKYLPVRRLALYIEESLYRGTKWVIFEPNDESLWSQIRLNVTAFMQDLFRKGAFQGVSPKQAYFVKCDSETTTTHDIDQRIVNIIVGFAPLKPAEFIILKIQQIAGQETI